MSDASRFAVSTSLFRHARLDREHLVEIAAHGFDGIELLATAPHFDPTDAAACAALAEWLDDTRLALVGVRAVPPLPSADAPAIAPGSLASRDAAERAGALDAVNALLGLAEIAPFPTLLVSLGTPGRPTPAGESAEAAHASVEALATLAGARGLRVALEIQANPWSTPDALAGLIETLDDPSNLGIAIDIGAARRLGDPVDAIEAASGHIIAARLYDVRGQRLEPLVPYDGAIDWDAVLLAFQKVGYCGPWTLEIASADDPQPLLTRAATARQRLEDSLGLSDEPYTS